MSRYDNQRSRSRNHEEKKETQETKRYKLEVHEN